MVSRLVVLRGFARNPKGLLTAICQRTFVSIKRSPDFLIRFDLGSLAGFKLGITTLTDANQRWSTLDEPKIASEHDCSLAHLAGRT